MLSTKTKQKVIKASALHDTDTGSPEVQIAVLTKKINELSKHLKDHKKDFHSRRGLLQTVADRRKHLKYLERNQPARYQQVVKKLKLD